MRIADPAARQLLVSDSWAIKWLLSRLRLVEAVSGWQLSAEIEDRFDHHQISVVGASLPFC
jgi:hypothetical protein